MYGDFSFIFMRGRMCATHAVRLIFYRTLDRLNYFNTRHPNLLREKNVDIGLDLYTTWSSDFFIAR